MKHTKKNIKKQRKKETINNVFVLQFTKLKLQYLSETTRADVFMFFFKEKNEESVREIMNLKGL